MASEQILKSNQIDFLKYQVQKTRKINKSTMGYSIVLLSPVVFVLFFFLVWVLLRHSFVLIYLENQFIGVILTIFNILKSLEIVSCSNSKSRPALNSVDTVSSDVRILATLSSYLTVSLLELVSRYYCSCSCGSVCCFCCC